MFFTDGLTVSDVIANNKRATTSEINKAFNVEE